MNPNQSRQNKAQIVTIAGASITFILAIIKIVFGLIGRSHSLFADGMHSLSDLLIDILVLFASRYGSQNADEQHPYGHGRIETAATLALSMILLLTGSGIIYDAYTHLFSQQPSSNPKIYALWIACLSIVINEILFFFSLSIGKKIQSSLLIANAWHHRSDSASSLVVVIGIVGAMFGYTFLDVIAAIIVGIMIIHLAWTLGWSSMRELVDTAVNPELLNAIKNAILETPGVLALHELRTRSAADKILIDVHVLVERYLSVSESHFIAAKVVEILKAKFSEINDVTVHIDYEEDHEFYLTSDLPSPHELLKIIESIWQPLPFAEHITRINFHYQAGLVEVEARLKIADFNGFLLQLEPVKISYQKSLAHLAYIKKVELLLETF